MCKIRTLVFSACFPLVLVIIQDEEQSVDSRPGAFQYEIVFASISNSSRMKLLTDGCAVSQ